MIERLGKQMRFVVFEAGNPLKWVALTLLKIPGVNIYGVHTNKIEWINQIRARQTLQSKRLSLINAIRGFLKQEGYKLPEKFFQNTNWREQLDRMRVGETQKTMLTDYMVQRNKVSPHFP
jgi:hypothetical protein